MSVQLTIPVRGKMRDAQLSTFAETLVKIGDQVGFKISSRGWCYQLEGFGTIREVSSQVQIQ